MRIIGALLSFTLTMNVVAAKATEYTPAGQQSLRIHRSNDAITFERCRGHVCIGIGKEDGTFKTQDLQHFIERAAANDPMVASFWSSLDVWLFKTAIPCMTLLGASHLASVVGHPIPFWPHGLGYVLAVPFVGAIFAKPMMDGERKTVKDQAAVLEIAMSEQFDMDAQAFDAFISNLDVTLRRVASLNSRSLAGRNSAKSLPLKNLN